MYLFFRLFDSLSVVIAPKRRTYVFSSNLTLQRMLNEDYTYFGFDHIHVWRKREIIAMHESNEMGVVLLAILYFFPSLSRSVTSLVPLTSLFFVALGQGCRNGCWWRSRR